jgi:hypothetical protein
MRILKMNNSGFVAGTLVHIKGGWKPIEEIRVGDWVLSYPEHQSRPKRLREEHEYTYRQVTQTFVTEDQLLSSFEVICLVDGHIDTIWATANHPIYCDNRDGWIPVSELDCMDIVENCDFGNLLVGWVYHAVKNARVYNFEVDEFHTYYVGENGVWVHDTIQQTS